MGSSRGVGVMSKQIVLEGKNGTRSILASRQATNQSNLEEDMAIWKIISDPNLLIEKTYNKKQEIVWKCKDKSLNTKTRNAVSKVMNTIFSRIVKNAQHRGFDSIDNIQFKDISYMAQLYLDADSWLQIDYCRDATRQSMDEDVQIDLLRKFLKIEVQKPTNGEYTVANGEIQNKKDVTEQKFARSVDAFIPSLSAYGFLKYSGPVGSVTSVHQVGESKSFIEECKQYCDKYQDGKIFFVQVDGGAGEDHLPEMLQMIREHSDRIFAGNSEQVIDWLNAKK
jgi:hypothetical protein